MAPALLVDATAAQGNATTARPSICQSFTPRHFHPHIWLTSFCLPPSLPLPTLRTAPSYRQLRKETYSRLTPTQRLQVARHPNRPTCLDIILNITDKFVELHGDRAGLDDQAIVCGIGSMDGMSFMFVGQQKGRNTKVCVVER